MDRTAVVEVGEVRGAGWLVFVEVLREEISHVGDKGVDAVLQGIADLDGAFHVVVLR
jgi:hypothetical protein